jgi:hypothetical protein
VHNPKLLGLTGSVQNCLHSQSPNNVLQGKKGSYLNKTNAAKEKLQIKTRGPEKYCLENIW